MVIGKRDWLRCTISFHCYISTQTGRSNRSVSSVKGLHEVARGCVKGDSSCVHTFCILVLPIPSYKSIPFKGIKTVSRLLEYNICFWGRAHIAHAWHIAIKWRCSCVVEIQKLLPRALKEKFCLLSYIRRTGSSVESIEVILFICCNWLVSVWHRCNCVQIIRAIVNDLSLS